MLRLAAVCKNYGERAILRGLSLHVPPGAVLLVTGPNGSGKSTLLRLMAGLIMPDAGSVTYAGPPGSIGYLGHDPLVYPHLTALENLAFWTRLHALPAHTDTLLDALDRMHLAHAADERAATFSRGMLQRLSFARLFLLGPRLALVDEPLSGLDGTSAALVRRALVALAEQGASVVWVSHDPDRDAPCARAVLALGADGKTHPAPVPAAPRSENSPQEAAAAPSPLPAGTPPGLFAAAWTIAAKDLRLMAGRSGSFTQALLLGFLFVVLFSLGIGGGQGPTPETAACIFWLCSAFCLTILTTALFALEEPGRPRLGLLLAPVPPQAVWLGKSLAALVLLLAVQAVFLAAATVFMGQGWYGNAPLALAGILLADAGSVALAALLAGLAVGQAARESLAALVLFPLLTPQLLAGMRLLASLYDPASSLDPPLTTWLAFAAACDAVGIGAALILFPSLYGGEG